MRPDRFRSFDASVQYDAVVIGAGLGGLTTAALLTRAGKKVLVIDQHYVAGGNATEFKRPGYVFDVGLHYIGDCGPKGSIPSVLEAAGVRLEYLPMDPEGFDTLCYPDGMRFAYPRGVDAFEARLLETFPGEAKGVRRWTSFLRQVWRLMQAQDHPLKLLAAVPRSLFAVRHLQSTLAEVLDDCTTHPRLRAVLCGPHMDHAVAPSRVSALLHAGLLMHYLVDGAYYPKGGGQRMSDGLVEVVEAGGGKVLLMATAERILVEGGRAAGVVFRSKHLGQVTVRAPIVVSNADLKKTFQRLLPAQAVPEALKAKVEGYEMAPGIAVLYLGVKREALGAAARPNTNYWIFPSDDMEHDYDALREGKFVEQPSVYVTLATNKDPSAPVAPEGVVNVQIMAMAPSDPRAWGVEVEGNGYRKTPAYLERKREVKQRMLARAQQVFPGLVEGIVYEEMATPLTHARYTQATGGTPYGLAATTAQFDKGRPAAATHLPGLLLAGASTRSAHGVLGAVTSGREASRAALSQLAKQGGRTRATPARFPALAAAHNP